MPGSDVSEHMKRAVDDMAVNEALTPSQIWDSVRSTFYGQDGNVAVRGLIREQVTRRVDRARAAKFGENTLSRVSCQPLAMVKDTNMYFFRFRNEALDKTNRKVESFIGWAHPVAIGLLKHRQISLFIDGTFRCVPFPFRQCLVLMVYDRSTKIYCTVFFILCSSRSYDLYWSVINAIVQDTETSIDAATIHCDFEEPLQHALMDFFPAADIIGCLFHFKQACKRKMQKLRIP